MKANYLFVITLLSVLFFSCKKDISDQKLNQDTPLKQENGRLVFDSQEKFYAFAEDLDNGKVDVNSNFSSLQKAFDKASLLEDESSVSPEVKDLQDFNFPPSFAKILNVRGEVKIGDEIIWYHSGKKYFIPAADEAQLQTIKLNPEAITKVTNAGSKITPVTLKNVSLNTSDRHYLSISGALSAIHQHEFNQVYPPSGGPRKYVHEIITFYDGYWVSGSVYMWFSAITLRIKMEWKNSSGKWRPAGETRNLTVNINGNAAMENPGVGGYEFGPVIQKSISLQVNADYLVPLAKWNGTAYPNWSPGPRWALDLWGTIYQHVVGDIASNAWYNTGTVSSPLW